jgi:hypothetical protein
MFYKEVPSSSVALVSSAQINFSNESYTSLESLFVNYFFSKGAQHLSTYKGAQLRSSSTFLKNIFDNLLSTLLNDTTNERDKIILRLAISTITNQLKLIEELGCQIDNETLNAIICGTVIRQIKTILN